MEIGSQTSALYLNIETLSSHYETYCACSSFIDLYHSL